MWYDIYVFLVLKMIYRLTRSLFYEIFIGFFYVFSRLILVNMWKKQFLKLLLKKPLTTTKLRIHK